MNFQRNNLIIGVVALIAFIGMGVFGLLPFGHVDHGVATPMVNCPYAEGSFSVCANTFDHITGWQQFSNIIAPQIFALLVLGAGLSLITKLGLESVERTFYGIRDYLRKRDKLNPNRDFIKWLSFFENSPSFACARPS